MALRLLTVSVAPHFTRSSGTSVTACLQRRGAPTVIRIQHSFNYVNLQVFAATANKTIGFLGGFPHHNVSERRTASIFKGTKLILFDAEAIQRTKRVGYMTLYKWDIRQSG